MFLILKKRVSTSHTDNIKYTLVINYLVLFLLRVEWVLNKCEVLLTLVCVLNTHQWRGFLFLS